MRSSSLFTSVLAALSASVVVALDLHTPIAPFGEPMVEGVAYIQQNNFSVIAKHTKVLVGSKFGPTGNVSFYFMPDGDFCSYDLSTNESLYCSNTGGNECGSVRGGCKFAWQRDGNCCIYVGVPEQYGYCTYTQNYTAGAMNSLVLTGMAPYFAIYNEKGKKLGNVFE